MQYGIKVFGGLAIIRRRIFEEPSGSAIVAHPWGDTMAGAGNPGTGVTVADTAVTPQIGACRPVTKNSHELYAFPAVPDGP